MMAPEHFFDTARMLVTRQVVVGDEDGTPITEPQTHAVDGWFDEPNEQQRGVTADRLGSAVSTAQRKALFAFSVDGDLKMSDEGEIQIGGVSEGRWTVEKIQTVPVPDGVVFREAMLLQVVEGR